MVYEQFKKMSVVVVAVGFALGMGFRVEAAPKARIVRLSQPVEVFFQAEGTWRQANKLMYLKAGDKIRTGEKGRAILALGRLNKLSLASNTTLELSSLASKAPAGDGGGTVSGWLGRKAERTFKIKLKEGKIYSRVPKLSRKSSYVIETPSATVGVRGTEFGVAAGQTGTGLNATAVGTTRGTSYFGPVANNGRQIYIENLVDANAAVDDLVNQIKSGKNKPRVTEPGQEVDVPAGHSAVTLPLTDRDGNAIDPNDPQNLNSLIEFFVNSGFLTYRGEEGTRFSSELDGPGGSRLPPHLNPMSSQNQSIDHSSGGGCGY